VLEARITALVAVIESIESRVTGRRDRAQTSADTHPDPNVRVSAIVRRYAYDIVLDDLASLLADNR
jgi:hypothetical protein